MQLIVCCSTLKKTSAFLPSNRDHLDIGTTILQIGLGTMLIKYERAVLYLVEKSMLLCNLLLD